MKDVGGYPGYRVTADGRVRGQKGDWLSPALSRSGYLNVVLFRNGKRWDVGVHRLVALAWIGEPPSSDHEVAHGDGNRTNNVVGNLRWATRKENAADREMHGNTVRGARHHNGKKTHCPQGHPYTPENTKMDGARRRCRTCSNARTLAWMNRNKSERKT